MIGDPVEDLKPLIRDFLRNIPSSGNIELDGIIAKKIGWRPHVLEQTLRRAWHIHTATPESEFWSERIEGACSVDKKIVVGIAAPEDLFGNEAFLEACDELGASLITYKSRRDGYEVLSMYGSVADLIYEQRIRLSKGCAEKLLTRALDRALKEKNKQRKGVLLEVVVALILSQVDGFEVDAVGISNRSQQMDVLVHNRNASGALSGSPVVLAEAKNWSSKVTPTEYAEFVRKLKSRNGRAKLGYLVTTNTFTPGVELERRRESIGDTLVVLVDRNVLPTIWTSSRTITAKVEQLTLEATIGH